MLFSSRRAVPFIWLYIAFALVVAIVPVTLAFAAWWSWEQHSAVADALKDQQATVKVFAAFQQAENAQRVQGLEAFARALGTTRLVHRVPALQQELEHSRALTGAIGAWVLDLHGTAIAFSPTVGPDGRSTIGHNYADRSYFKAAMTSGRTAVSTLFVGRQLKRPNLVFVTPVREAGRIVGLFGMAFDMRSFAAGLVAHAPSVIGRVFLLDRTQTVMRADVSRQAAILESWQHSPLGSLPLATGGSQLMTVGAQAKLVSWEPVPRLGMVVGIEIGRADRVAEGRSEIQDQVLIAGAVALLLIVAVSLIGGRISSTHLRRLGSHLRALAAGDAALDAAFPTSRVKELAALGDDARFMARTISQRQREIEVLYRLDKELAAATHPDAICRIGVEQAVQVLGFDAGVAFLIDKRRSILRLANAYHVSTPTLRRLETLPIGSGAAGRAVAARRVIRVAIEDYPDRDALPPFETIREVGIRSLISAPMIAHAEVHGAITLATARDDVDDEHAMALLGSIATQVALAIAHAQERDRAIAQDRMAAVGRLASGVAHELRNPLTILMARVDMLQNADGQKRADLLTRSLPGLSEATARMRRIVTGLSTYSKPAAAAPAPLNLSELLPATKELITGEAKKCDVAVTVDAADTLPPVLGDRSEMMQVLLNLANNAVEAMAETGGALRIGARVEAARVPDTETAPEPRVVIEIADTGPGIRPEQLAEIWEPFFTTKADGTGLGLSIVRSLVAKQPGAAMTVESTEGKGTTFRLTMPAMSG